MFAALVSALGAGSAWWTARHRSAHSWRPPAGEHHHLALQVRTLGDGPPVVLLHGLLGSGRFWGAEFDQLANDHRVIAPDLLGFGRSPHPDHGYTADDHADAVAATLDGLGITTAAVVVGHSLGALIALRLAARRPARVAAIVAFGPPLYPDPETAKRYIGGLGGLTALLALDTPWARRACEWMCDHRAVAGWLAVALHPELPISVALDSVQHSWASYSRTLSEVIVSARAAEWLEGLTIPIVVVAGDEDRVVDGAYLDGLALRSRMTLERWAGAHDLPLSRPADCAARIAAVAA
ncbi:MAG: alpha/beta hydrolase, partial [Actinomycetota bacterium]|nr:alpha/beta hydrolase [Actinomycetota bacterium]